MSSQCSLLNYSTQKKKVVNIQIENASLLCMCSFSFI